jgi:hypothetical protein
MSTPPALQVADPEYPRYTHGDGVIITNTHSAALPGTFLAYVGPLTPDVGFDFCEVLTTYGVVTTQCRHVRPAIRKEPI